MVQKFAWAKSASACVSHPGRRRGDEWRPDAAAADAAAAARPVVIRFCSRLSEAEKNPRYMGLPLNRCSKQTGRERATFAGARTRQAQAAPPHTQPFAPSFRHAAQGLF